MKNITEILNDIKSEKHLLLGNGFSIAVWDGFKNNFISHEDFKMIVSDLMHNLSSSIKNEGIEGILRRIKKFDSSLKKKFINEIIKNHPNYINVKNKLKKMNFLLKFNSIFSLNYDLILSWFIRDNQTCFEEYFDQDFKFNYDTTPNDKILVYYPHGALNIFSKNEKNKIDEINKSKFYTISGNKKKSLTDMIKELNKESNLPIIILDGNSENKFDNIQKNNYLKFCYEKFKEIKGDLIIFGCSLREQDNHIIDIINSNPNIINIYYGKYYTGQIEEKTDINEEMNKIFPGKKVEIFDSSVL